MRVWNVRWIPRAWVIDKSGTPWLVILPPPGASRVPIQRGILYQFPAWEPENELVAKFVLYAMSRQDRPSAADWTWLGEYIVSLKQQTADEEEKETSRVEGQSLPFGNGS